MRIAVISGGAFAHVGPYIDFYRSRGHDVSLIAYIRPDRDFGVPTYDISRGASGRASLSKWKYVWAGITARRLLRKLAPDIVHGHYVSSAGMICLMSGFQPYALTAHGSDLLSRGRSRLWRPLLSWAMGRAVLVNTVSEELKQLAMGLGVSSQRILVSTLGIDVSGFPMRQSQAIGRPLRLLCTRTLAPIYDPATIVNACRGLQDRGIDFTMTFAAGGSMQPELQSLAETLGLHRRIHFLGGYTGSQLPLLLAGHDVYLSASHWDGTSLSLLEAMACGIFPVVSRIPSNMAWLEEGRTALMFDCGEAEQLIGSIERILREPEWFSGAVALNREVVEKRGDRLYNMRLLEERMLQLVG